MHNVIVYPTVFVYNLLKLGIEYKMGVFFDIVDLVDSDYHLKATSKQEAERRQDWKQNNSILIMHCMHEEEH